MSAISNNLHQILDFTSFLIKFRNTKRTIYLPGSDVLENDAEHSFQLAMLAWQINKIMDLNHDDEKLMTYALVHDLVEVYAGDTYIYTQDQNLIESKDDREAAALAKIQNEFAGFGELSQSILNYNSKTDPESKFIYALDKLIPMINIYLDNGLTWKKEGVSLNMILDKKTKKVSIDPTVNTVYQELVEILKQNELKLFGA